LIDACDAPKPNRGDPFGYFGTAIIIIYYVNFTISGDDAREIKQSHKEIVRIYNWNWKIPFEKALTANSACAVSAWID